MIMREILVKKEDGNLEKFNAKKIKKSLKHLGINDSLTDKLIEDIYNKAKFCKEGGICSTQDIYKGILNNLKKNKDKKFFLRYNLPLAISKLGPEGFAFEKFVGEIFEAYKYSPVFVGKKIPGKCISNHEMDIVAHKDNTIITAELKFHNSRSKKTDLKVALYMKARFDDIEESGFYGDSIPRKMIITNTKFTENTKKYSKCVDIDVLSWNFPEKNNLHDFILHSGVHPVTSLESISNKAKEFFVKKKIVSCNDILKSNNRVLEENHFIPKKNIPLVLKEIEEIKKNNYINTLYF